MRVGLGSMEEVTLAGNDVVGTKAWLSGIKRDGEARKWWQWTLLFLHAHSGVGSVPIRSGKVWRWYENKNDPEMKDKLMQWAIYQALVSGARAAAVDGKTLTLFLGRSECRPATWVLCIGLQWMHHDLPLVPPLTTPHPWRGKALFNSRQAFLQLGRSAAVLECTVQQCAPHDNAAFSQNVHCLF